MATRGGCDQVPNPGARLNDQPEPGAAHSCTQISILVVHAIGWIKQTYAHQHLTADHHTAADGIVDIEGPAVLTGIDRILAHIVGKGQPPAAPTTHGPDAPALVASPKRRACDIAPVDHGTHNPHLGRATPGAHKPTHHIGRHEGIVIQDHNPVGAGIQSPTQTYVVATGIVEVLSRLQDGNATAQVIAQESQGIICGTVVHYDDMLMGVIAGQERIHTGNRLRRKVPVKN